jgi:cytochrome c553
MRWTAYGAGVLVLAAGAAAATGAALADRKLQRQVDVKVVAVPLPEDETRLARGKYLYETRGCTDCHGLDGAGRQVIDDGGFRVRGPQIAPGAASVTASYRTEDWVRAIRHGVAPSGRPLLIMPSEDYNRLSDEDLGAMVAHLRRLPQVAGKPAEISLPLPVRVLYGFGAIRDAAEKIDHALPPQQPVAHGATVEYGRYVANMCVGCHGDHLSGGKVPGGPPDWPAAANLTPGQGSAMPRYADAKAFAGMLRTGKRPDGTTIAVMPFEALSKMDDTEVAALYAFLGTLQPRAAGGR